MPRFMGISRKMGDAALHHRSYGHEAKTPGTEAGRYGTPAQVDTRISSSAIAPVDAFRLSV